MLISEKIADARIMAASIKKLLEYADQQGDFLLAAKLADAQAVFLERYLSGEPDGNAASGAPERPG